MKQKYGLRVTAIILIIWMILILLVWRVEANNPALAIIDGGAHGQYIQNTLQNNGISDYAFYSLDKYPLDTAINQAYQDGHRTIAIPRILTTCHQPTLDAMNKQDATIYIAQSYTNLPPIPNCYDDLALTVAPRLSNGSIPYVPDYWTGKNIYPSEAEAWLENCEQYSCSTSIAAVMYGYLQGN